MGWFHAVLTSTCWNEICRIVSQLGAEPNSNSFNFQSINLQRLLSAKALSRQMQQILPNQMWLWLVGVCFKKSTSHGESSPAGLTDAQKGLQMRLLIKIAAPSTHYPILCGHRIFKIFDSKFPSTRHLMRRTNQYSITNHSYTVITLIKATHFTRSCW